MSWVSQSLSVLHISPALHTSFSACLPPRDWEPWRKSALSQLFPDPHRHPAQGQHGADITGHLLNELLNEPGE